LLRYGDIRGELDQLVQGVIVDAGIQATLLQRIERKEDEERKKKQKINKQKRKKRKKKMRNEGEKNRKSARGTIPRGQ
jgi:hypothetical protein